jgi:hypothetical protein
MRAFLTWTEGSAATVSQALGQALRTMDQLCALIARNNEYAPKFLSALRSRLTSTTPMDQLLLGYLVTAEGLNWYHSLPPGPVGAPYFTQAYVRNTIVTALEYFRLYFCLDAQGWRLAWDHYLSKMHFQADETTAQFWARHENQRYEVGPGIDFRFLHLAQTAFILTHIPCSETECERTFSGLHLALDDLRHRMTPELANAYLSAKINGLGPPEFVAEVEQGSGLPQTP